MPKTKLNRRYVTVVYEIVDETEWRKTNPIHYEHNGLKAVGVSASDLMEQAHNLNEMLSRVADYFGESCTHEIAVEVRNLLWPQAKPPSRFGTWESMHSTPNHCALRGRERRR